jgi:hypothetical protein
MGRACVHCHAVKTKCMKENENEDCQRCKRLFLECLPHESRQGQGPRKSRRKASEGTATSVVVDPSVTTTTPGTLTESSVCNNGSMDGALPSEVPICRLAEQNATSGGDGRNGMCSGNASGGDSSDGMEPAMAALQLEDEVVCKGIQGLESNHYGLHGLIRQWVSLSFTRRSFNLLSRATFLAARCGISMDDILSNRSPFAAMTNSKPLTFLPSSILLPKEEQDVLGPPLDLQELPWDFLQAIRVDPRLDETTRNRWIFIRYTAFGKCRFYVSPRFEEDFAALDEIEKTWVENKHEVKDLWFATSQMVRVAEPFFNLLYLNRVPNLPVFVTRCPLNVRMKKTQEVVKVDCNVSMKQVDLDTFFYMNEILFRRNGRDNPLGGVSSGENKRNISDLTVDDNESVLGDDFEYTDLPMTDDLEEWLHLVSDAKENQSTGETIPI